MPAMEKMIEVREEFIRLDALLKLAGAVETGGQAKLAIQSGLVQVNDETCLMRGKKIRNGDKVSYRGENYVCQQTFF